MELFWTIPSRMVASFELHSCLADLGIRRNTRTLGIVATAGEFGDIRGVAVDGDMGFGWSTEEVDGVLGGLPEPGHLADNGP